MPETIAQALRLVSPCFGLQICDEQSQDRHASRALRKAGAGWRSVVLKASFTQPSAVSCGKPLTRWRCS